MSEEAAEPKPTNGHIVAPSHYTRGGMQATEFCEAYDLNPRLTDAVRYIARHATKGGGEDLLKAAWNLCREILKTQGQKGHVALLEIVDSLARPSELELARMRLASEEERGRSLCGSLARANEAQRRAEEKADFFQKKLIARNVKDARKAGKGSR